MSILPSQCLRLVLMDYDMIAWMAKLTIVRVNEYL